MLHLIIHLREEASIDKLILLVTVKVQDLLGPIVIDIWLLQSVPVLVFFTSLETASNRCLRITVLGLMVFVTFAMTVCAFLGERLSILVVVSLPLRIIQEVFVSTWLRVLAVSVGVVLLLKVVTHSVCFVLHANIG